jgi:hypothetical protein
MSKADKILVKEIFDSLIDNPQAVELGTFGREDLQDIAQRIPYIKGIKNAFNIALKIKHEFPFDELELRDAKNRSLFSLAIAQSWFLEEIGISSYHGDLSSFAVLIGTNYSLNINIHQITNDLSKYYPAFQKYSINVNTFLPIEYNRIFEKWPELERLGSAPVMSKKCLILITRISNPTLRPWISFQDLPDFKTLKPYVEDLVSRNLVNDNPAASDLLGCLKNETLKKFIVSQGLIPPTRKQDLVEFIKKHCTDIKIKELIENENVVTLPLQQNIINLNEFRQYVFNEMNRLNLYSLWIRVMNQQTHIANSNQPEKGKNIQAKVWSLQDFLNENDHRIVNLKGDDLFGGFRKHEKEIFTKYWDSTCEEFLQKAIEENRKKFPDTAVIREVVKYWQQSGSLDTIKEATPIWHTLLLIFVEKKLLQDKYYQLEPIELTCAGCGKKFLKSSIFIRTAVKVEMNIQFCYSCYVGILYEGGVDRKQLVPEKDSMLRCLFELCQETSFIPTKGIMTNFPLPSYPTEKQILIGRMLLKMPPFETYVSAFGSWLASLLEAKVINKYLETQRGIQCLAEDEHICLSLGEKIIDDWLYKHSIQHEKEVLYLQDAELNPQKKLRADWRVGNVFIEYAGMMEDGNYYAKMQRKQRLAEKLKFTLIILEPEDITSLDFNLGFLKAN